MSKTPTPPLPALPDLLAIQTKRAAIRGQLEAITTALEAAESDLDAAAEVDAERLQTLRAEKAAMLADAAIQNASRIKAAPGPAELQEGLSDLEAEIEVEAAKVSEARKLAKAAEARARDTIKGLEAKREALLGDLEALKPEHGEALARVLGQYINRIAGDYIGKAAEFVEAFRALHGLPRMYFLRSTPAGPLLDRVFAPLSGQPPTIPEPHASLPAVAAFRAERYGNVTLPAWSVGIFDHLGPGPRWNDLGDRTATEHRAALEALGVEFDGLENRT